MMGKVGEWDDLGCGTAITDIRRTIRDYSLKVDASTKDILDDLRWYLEKGRPLFELSGLIPISDMVLDGLTSTGDHVEEIRRFLKIPPSSSPSKNA